MTPTPESITRLKKLVAKLENGYGLDIRFYGGDEAWFLRINNHSAAGNVEFHVIRDMLETIDFLGIIGLLKSVN